MQPHPGYGAHHELLPIQDDESSPSSLFSISNNHPPLINQSHNHHFYQPHLFNHQVQFQPLFPQQQETQRLVYHQHLGFQQPHPFSDVNFKLGLNSEYSGVVNKEDDASLAYGNEQPVSGIRQHNSIVIPNCWHSQEDSPAIKQPFWKSSDQRPNINSNTQCNEGKGNDRCKHLEGKYRICGNELEAICNLAKGIDNQTNQNASGSAVTGDSMLHRSKNVGEMIGSCAVNNLATAGVDLGSDNSMGEEASLTGVGKKKQKRKMKENNNNNNKLKSWAGFIEGLVKKVMEHQENLHKKFLQVVERIDKERSERDELWRRQQAEKCNREAIARAHEQALASNRESIIVSHIEKITGKKVNLPPKKNPLVLQQEITKESPMDIKNPVVDSNSRWPKAEVEALIQVRSGLESRFVEPGLKGPLWEEVSCLMASMGYHRSAKRCKEKWENINKYFRKTKESGKKRSLQSKTCAYFDHLDQLYSRHSANLASSSSSGNPSLNTDVTAVQSPRVLGISEAELKQVEDKNNVEEEEEEEEEDQADCGEED